MSTLYRLDNLHPQLKAKGLELVKRAKAAGITIGISQGLRTIAEQNKLYAQGRTILYDSKGKRLYKVTNARGGYSMHNYGLAFDVVVYNPDGSANWSDAPYRKIGPIGEALGLEWGGRWTNPYDAPHYQLDFGLSLSQLRAGKKPPGWSGVSAAAVDPNKPYLELGDSGVLANRVKQLQQLLNKAGATPKISEDGAFGEGTKAAVIQFQKRTGLTADGVAGPATLRNLNEVLAPEPIKPAAPPAEKIIVETKEGGTEMKDIFYPSKSILDSTARVFGRLSNKDVHGDQAIDPSWRERLLKGELTVEDVVSIYGVAYDRGLFVGPEDDKIAQTILEQTKSE